MPVVVFARPERLHGFRQSAHGVSDGLEIRSRALGAAVDNYRARTEAAFEADCAGIDDAVHAVVLAVRQLGQWVGQVGDAFERIVGFGGVVDGRYLATSERLGQALPAELRIDDDAEPSAGIGFDDGLTLASAAAAGLRRGEVQALAFVVGRDGAAGRVLGAAAQSPQVPRLARFLDVTAALRIGAHETAHRWEAEADRAPVERAARAAVDGALTGGGSYGGAAAGAWAGAALCGPTLVGVPACASAGSYAGGWLGSRAGEWLGDRLLGPEPEPPARDPEALAAEVGDVDAEVVDALRPVVDAAADEAAETAVRHADFVLEHPWLWDDAYADAPHHEPPPPSPVLPRTGPA